jgi:hypothetical protein
VMKWLTHKKTVPPALPAEKAATPVRPGSFRRR